MDFPSDSPPAFLPYLVAAWLFVIGLYGIATSRNLIHMTVCLAVVQSSTYVLLLSAGYVTARDRRSSPMCLRGRRRLTRSFRP